MDEFTEVLEFTKLILTKLISFGESMNYAYQNLPWEGKMIMRPVMQQWNDIAEELRAKAPKQRDSQEDHSI